MPSNVRAAISTMVLVLGSLVVTPARAAAPQDLARLCDDYWQGYLEANPVSASGLGDHRYDDRLDDNSTAGYANDQRRLERVLARAKAISPAGLSAPDRLTRSALIEEVESQLGSMSCHMEEWVVDPLGGPQIEFMNLADYITIETPRQAFDYVKRCRAMGPYLDQHIANLRRGLATQRVASRDPVAKTLDELAPLVDGPVSNLAAMRPARDPHPTWKPEERDRFAKDLRGAMDQALRPGLERYRRFLKEEVLPVARPQEKAGLAALPGGADCYAKRIRAETSLEQTPEALHQLGLDQVARFRRDLSALGMKVFGTGDVAEIQKRLRNDPAMHFATAAEIEAKARQTLARAEAAVPKWFGRNQPKAPCKVTVMGMHEAPYSTIAYYREPSPDGKRPGQYMINTYKPETRPRYEAEALAFHESVPGHHLQISVAQELTGIPEFRKHQGVTAYVEGWGLYSERLADEMGLYSSDVDRLGMLSYDAWRACRLVVDTGLHSMGWSRQQAIDYMIENSCLAENNIVNEVDRYISWPAQALAYKVGQLEILRLREEAKRRLGDRFDIKAFHDVVLGNGAVALPVLREQVEEWVRREGGTP